MIKDCTENTCSWLVKPKRLVSHTRCLSSELHLFESLWRLCGFKNMIQLGASLFQYCTVYKALLFAAFNHILPMGSAYFILLTRKLLYPLTMWSNVLTDYTWILFPKVDEMLDLPSCLTPASLLGEGLPVSFAILSVVQQSLCNCSRRECHTVRSVAVQAFYLKSYATVTKPKLDQTLGSLLLA